MTAVELYTPERKQEAMTLLGLSGPKNQIELLFLLGEKYQLDVFTKEVTLIPGKGPFIGVWGRLHIAHRSGRLDGLEMDDEWETDKHHCVRVVVWHKDMSRPVRVVGRVGKHERKDWPFEIARARGLRAGLGFAFSIHDAYDATGDEDEWVDVPDERVTADGTVVTDAEVVEEPAKPKRTRKKVSKATGEVVVASPGEGQVNRPEPDSAREADAAAAATDATVADSTSKGPDPAPDRTVVVGGHTRAQQAAMAARDAGIDDDDVRHDIIRVASRGTWNRGTEIPDGDLDPDQHDLWRRVLDAFKGLADGTVELRYGPEPGDARLYKVNNR